MKQNILIAFDDSENSMRAAGFVAGAFAPENRVTLFHVLQDTAALCEMNSPELSSYFLSQQTAFCALEDQKKILVDEAMQKAKAVFVEAGFNASDIRLKIEPRKIGVAGDIVDEAKSGYSIIVVGRRGLSGIREFIMGSVSQKILHAAKELSVLMVN
jgi:nucleotide-binding universal stress UspA family protein